MRDVIPRCLRLAALGALTLPLSACLYEEPRQLPDVAWLEGTIAFVCEHDGGTNDELCLMNADGSNIRRITDNAGPDRAPSWNAAGTRLVFNSRRDPHADRPQIYSFDVASGNTIRVSDGALEDQRASWTPDGNSVVFQRGTFIIGYELFRQPAAFGSIPEQLTFNSGRINAAGSYSPDGRTLLLQSNRAVAALFPFASYAIDVATGVERRLAEEVADSHDGPRWSPAGDRIAFSAGGTLYVVSAANGAITQVTDDDFSNSSPAWSPDGRMLVFQSDRLDEELITIHVIDLETRQIGYLGVGRTPVWSDLEF